MRITVLFVLCTILISGRAFAEDGCLARLDELGASYRLLPPIEGEGACGASRPIQMLALPPVSLSPPGTFTCPFAVQLARWMKEVVIPAARLHLGAVPTAFRVGTSYQCRGQNRRPGVKLSEHSYANALDLMGFEFGDDVTLGIRPDREPTSPAGRFQRAVRTGSCRFFTTVLGPGADGFHQDHLHLDLRRRNGDYRICQ